jgi:hypothetical protein
LKHRNKGTLVKIHPYSSSNFDEDESKEMKKEYSKYKPLQSTIRCPSSFGETKPNFEFTIG